MDQLNEIIEKVDYKEISQEQGYKLIRELIEVTGFFTIDDLQYIYELGRAHQENKSICTSKEIRNSWLWADRINRNIKWE